MAKSQISQLFVKDLLEPDAQLIAPTAGKTTTLPTLSDLSDVFFVPTFERPIGDHASRSRFHHPWTVPKRDATALKWLLTRQKAEWPLWQDNVPTDSLPHSRPDAALNDWQMWFVGHATVLIQIGPYNFLTDPVWAMRTSPVGFAGPRRVRPAGIALEDLPTIDAVLLSHNHYDHMDHASLKWLYQRDRMPIYTGLVNGQYLPDEMRVIELDWWQSTPFHKDDRLQIVYTPAQHFSGRGLADGNAALWGGLSILTPDDHLFFAGDTGYAEHFSQVRERLGAPRMALLPIGAYEPRAVMKSMHMNPADAVQAHIDLAAKQSLAIHHRTFQLTDEAMNQPLIELAQALNQAGVAPEQFATPDEGHSILA